MLACVKFRTRYAWVGFEILEDARHRREVKLVCAG